MDDHVPVWVAVVCGSVPMLCAAGYATYKLFSHIRTGNAAARRADRKDRADGRREAAAEAWDVVDRLTARVNELEERERTCMEERAAEQANHAATRAILKMLVAWALRQRNPPYIPEDVLTDLDLSGPHTPIKE